MNDQTNSVEETVGLETFKNLIRDISTMIAYANESGISLPQSLRAKIGDLFLFEQKQSEVSPEDEEANNAD